jgi:hypothetical protein
MLIFNPVGTWEKIESSPKTVRHIFFVFLLPLMLISTAAETWGLLRLGLERSTIGDMPVRRITVSPALAIRYQVVQFTFNLLIIFGGAWIYQKIGASFHRRHSYAETFATLAYAISPFFVLQIFDGLPALNTWVCWGIGAALSLAALYRGIPRIMKPDPSSALGLYVMCSVVLIALSGLAHFFADLVLEEKFLANQW